MASLNNDDLNHATTFYYLLQAAKEYWSALALLYFKRNTLKFNETNEK